MIKLEVKDYCENCPEFEAEVTKSHVYSFGQAEEKSVITETVIKCEHAARCETIMKYVRKSYDNVYMQREQ